MITFPLLFVTLTRVNSSWTTCRVGRSFLALDGPDWVSGDGWLILTHCQANRAAQRPGTSWSSYNPALPWTPADRCSQNTSGEPQGRPPAWSTSSGTCLCSQGSRLSDPQCSDSVPKLSHIYHAIWRHAHCSDRPGSAISQCRTYPHVTINWFCKCTFIAAVKISILHSYHAFNQ